MAGKHRRMNRPHDVALIYLRQIKPAKCGRGHEKILFMKVIGENLGISMA